MIPIYSFAGIISLPIIIGGVCIYKYNKFYRDYQENIAQEITMIDILFY